MKLSYRIIFIGVSSVYGITNFMIPYVKENWRHDIVAAVADLFEEREKKMKARELAEKSARRWGFLGL
jgi:hypothetical protein